MYVVGGLTLPTQLSKLTLVDIAYIQKDIATSLHSLMAPQTPSNPLQSQLNSLIYSMCVAFIPVYTTKWNSLCIACSNNRYSYCVCLVYTFLTYIYHYSHVVIITTWLVLFILLVLFPWECTFPHFIAQL